jgi:branched-chain amino acid transport system substrate-binding protein
VFIGWGGDDTDALRPRVREDRVPFMSAAYAETLADPAVTPYNFFPGTSYSQQMRIALKFIADQNKGRRVEVAVFHHDSPFGTSPLDDGKRFIADRKLDIGYRTYAMPDQATDYTAQIGQAKAQGAKYIIIQNTLPWAATLATNLADQKSTAQIVCLNWCADELFVKVAGRAAEKMIGVMPFSPPVAGVEGLETINNFLKAKGTDANARGVRYVQGWSTMAVMAEGIANALKANDGKIDGGSIRAGLEKVSGFKTGVSDPITFTAENHAGLKTASLFQVEGGVFKKIAGPIGIE